MYYVLYDKDFKAIGETKTHKISKWSYTKKAFEFSELNIEGVAAGDTTNATYVGLHEDSGKLAVMMYSGIPTTEKGITKINAIDIRQLLNVKAIIDFTEGPVVLGVKEWSVNSVKSLYEYLLGLLSSQYTNLGAEIIVDVTEVADDLIVFNEDAITRTKEIGNIWNTLQAVNALYECYVESKADFKEKKITFKVKRIIQTLSLKLADFSAPKIRNDFTGINRVVCLTTDLLHKVTFYLLNNDYVLLEDQATTEEYEDNIIYPPRTEVIVADMLKDAVAEGLQLLYKNRFQANVTLNIDNQMGYVLQNVDLNYKAKIYGFNTDKPGSFKELPAMEISKNSDGKHQVKFGRLEEYWWLN